MNERCVEILNLLSQQESIEVNELSARLAISAVTVRKDLDLLEEKGLLKRQHGCAVRIPTDDVGFRMIVNYNVKKAIAEKAASLVEPGEAVMIESGSTCALLAETLAKTLSDVTIITNSAFICNQVKDFPGTRALLLGGQYDAKAQVVTGPLVRLCARQFYTDKFFIGVDGYDLQQGFSNVNLYRAETVQAMAESTKHVIALADASKFHRRSVVTLLPDEEVSAVICDGLPEDCREKLEKAGVQIMVV